MPARAQSPSTPNALIVRAVETTGIRVSLARTYRGSQYQMTHRSTAINRSQLRDGILQLSEHPGLGWELDEDFIDRYRVSSA
jgi:L-alanine-DL-glutamate epimerase-like enolase superfamily enzyme